MTRKIHNIAERFSHYTIAFIAVAYFAYNDLDFYLDWMLSP